MKTNTHLTQFLEWKMLQTKVLEKIKTHISCSINFFLFKSCCLWDNVEKYCRATQATEDTMGHAHCMQDTWGYKQALRICDTYCFSTAKMVVQTHLNVKLCVHHLSCFCASSFAGVSVNSPILNKPPVT